VGDKGYAILQLQLCKGLELPVVVLAFCPHPDGTGLAGQIIGDDQGSWVVRVVFCDVDVLMRKRIFFSAMVIVGKCVGDRSPIKRTNRLIKPHSPDFWTTLLL
jgi:hypothetical protein